MEFQAVTYAVAAFLAVPAVLVFPPLSLFRTVLYPLPFILWLQACLAPPPSWFAKPSYLNHFGLQLGLLGLRILDRVYLHNPEETFRYRDGSDPATYNPMRKFWWALELVAVTRGVGWNWDVTLKNPETSKGRLAFLQRRTRKILGIGAQLTFFEWLARELVSREQDVVSWHQNSNFVLSVLLSGALRMYIMVGYCIVTYASVTLAYDILSVIFVTLRLGGSWAEPASWPPLFGSPLEAYSFRRFWSVFWHQQWRRSLSAPGLRLVSAIPGFSSEKTGRRQIRLYLLMLSAFALSACVHGFGNFYVSRGIATSKASDGGAFAFYTSQAAVLIVEDMVWKVLEAKLGGLLRDANGPTTIRRRLGILSLMGFGIVVFPAKLSHAASSHGYRAANGMYLMDGVETVGLRASYILRQPGLLLFSLSKG